MRLIYERTGKPVQIGDMVHLNNTAFTVARIQEPHKPSSTGRVYITPLVGGTWCEYFPSVIGAKWIGRTDGWIESKTGA